MKKVVLLVLLASALLSGKNVFAQGGKCEKEIIAKSEISLASRGKDKNIKVGMKNGIRVYLKDPKAKSRGQKPGCMISLYNEADQDVDVFVDGNYIGSIVAGMQGMIESIIKYEKVYCVSADKKLSWSQFGDCQCIYIYKLQK